MKEVIEAIKANIGRVLVGKEEVTDLLLSAILAGGHVLLEDVPGTGKVTGKEHGAVFFEGAVHAGPAAV